MFLSLVRTPPDRSGRPAADPPAWVAAHPALAAKAPGAPGYGLQITTTTGKVLMTNLSFDPDHAQGPGTAVWHPWTRRLWALPVRPGAVPFS